MELKEPTPLGETSTIQKKSIQTKPKVETVERKPMEYSLPKVTIPKIKLPHINIPKINLPKIDTSKLPNKKIIKVSSIVVPLFLLIVLLIAVLIYTRSEPYRIADKFMHRVEEKDTRGAYALTTDAYRAVTPEKEFKKVVDRLNSVDISRAKVTNKIIDSTGGLMGEYAFVTYKISGYYLDLVLYNDTRDWGILSIELTTIK